MYIVIKLTSTIAKARQQKRPLQSIVSVFSLYEDDGSGKPVPKYHKLTYFTESEVSEVSILGLKSRYRDRVVFAGAIYPSHKLANSVKERLQELEENPDHELIVVSLEEFYTLIDRDEDYWDFERLSSNVFKQEYT